MRLTKEIAQANLIRAWERGRVRIGEQWLSGNLIVTADQIAQWSADDPRTLDIEHLGPAIGLQPEIILIGTGSETLLPDVALMTELAARGIGVEIMTTPSACRTFNVLVHEGRHVAVALFN